LRPGATKSGKNHFETFYVGAEGTQYFIKPLAFSKTTTGEDLLVDFTFRYRDVVSDTAILHISLHGPDIIRTVDHISFATHAMKVRISPVELMFNETGKEGFHSRFECFMSLSDLNRLFSDPDWRIVVCGSGPCSEYEATDKTRKIIPKLEDTVFVLMR
jgi:hypothetical protein